MQQRQTLREKYRYDPVILACRKDLAAVTEDNKMPPTNLVSRYFDKKTAILLQILLELKERNNSIANAVLPFMDVDEAGNQSMMSSSSNAMMHFSITMFTELDRVENLNIHARMGFIQGLTRARILNQLTEFAASARYVKITPETVSLWRELAIWLECIYQNTPTNDMADAILKRMINVTKFEIVKYYHQASECLMQKIDAFLHHEDDAEATDRDCLVMLSRMI